MAASSALTLDPPFSSTHLLPLPLRRIPSNILLLTNTLAPFFVWLNITRSPFVEHKGYPGEGVSSLLQAGAEPNAAADRIGSDRDVTSGLSSVVYLCG